MDIEVREIWVYIDRRDERLFAQSLGALGKAAALAEDLSARALALFIGEGGAADGCVGMERAAKECADRGAAGSIGICFHSETAVRADLFVGPLAELVKERNPMFVAFALSDFGRELGARVARLLDAGFIADGESFVLKDNKICALCPSWGGEVMAEIYFADQSKTGFITLSPHGSGTMAAKPGSADLERVPAPMPEGPAGLELLSSSPAPPEQRALEDAELVAAGGAGLQDPAGFALVRSLAAAMGGEVGATRPAVSRHWAGERRLIGQTGKSVRPRLLFSVGTSGAVQYTAGIVESEKIVAINRDPEAPIFDLADIGVVADAKSVLPPLIERVKRASMRGLADLLCDKGGGEGMGADFGSKARSLREAHGLGVEQLAEKTGKDPDYIGRVEAGEETPSVSFLLRLAAALEVDPGTFLSEEEKTAIKDERDRAVTTRTEQYSYRIMTPGDESVHLRGFLVEIEPRQAHKPVAYRHEGEEFVYVLEGELELTLGNRSHQLKKHEWQHFNSETPHKLKSLSDEPTKCLVMLYTP